MKFYLIVIATTILFSSCLKQSIPDAMLASIESGTGGSAGTLSYEVNGNPVKISVAANLNCDSYRLRCEKSVGFYALSGLSSSGEILFLFFTDSLKTGTYNYPGIRADRYFLSYNGQNAYAQYPSDILSFTITSYDNGYISGSFSGKLTPLITAGNPNNTYGTPSSVIITNGSFQNVKVFY